MIKINFLFSNCVILKAGLGATYCHCTVTFLEIMFPKHSHWAQPVFPAQLYGIITILDAVINLSSVLILTKAELHLKEGFNWLFFLKWQCCFYLSFFRFFFSSLWGGSKIMQKNRSKLGKQLWRSMKKCANTGGGTCQIRVFAVTIQGSRV